jgi:hypothetical protein
MAFPVGLAIGLGGSLVSGLFGGAQQSCSKEPLNAKQSFNMKPT